MARQSEDEAKLHRSLGQALAAYRKASSLTQSDLARATNYDRTSIAHIEAGRQSPPERTFWQTVDTSVSAHGALLDQYDAVCDLKLSLKQDELRRTQATHRAQADNLSLETVRTVRQLFKPDQKSAEGCEVAELVPQLDITTDIKLNLTELGRPTGSDFQNIAKFGDYVEPWELTEALTRSAISATTLEHMESVAYDAVARYPTLPPNVLLPQVSRQLNRIQEALNKPQRIRERRRAVVLLGVLAGISGNLWLDLGRTDTSTHFFNIGELAASEADAADLGAWVLAVRSISSFYEGCYQDAADLLERAEKLASMHSSGRRRAWIAALRARAEAAVGGRIESLRTLERSYAALAEATSLPTGADFFDAPRLDGIAGMAYLELGDTTQASQLLHSALNQRAVSDIKGRALITLDLAKCYTVDREPEEAARLAVTALHSASGSAVVPIVDRARELLTHLAPWGEQAAVREFDMHVRQLTNG